MDKGQSFGCVLATHQKATTPIKQLTNAVFLVKQSLHRMAILQTIRRH